MCFVSDVYVNVKKTESNTNICCQDELVAVSEKSVLRVGDLLDWQVECYLVWLVSVLSITYYCRR